MRRLAAVLLSAVLLGGVPAVSQADPSGDLNAQIAVEAQKVAAHEQRKPSLEAAIDAHNEKVAVLGEKVAALQQRASDHASKVSSLSQRVDAHNAAPHQFELPRQAVQARAYDNEAAQLNAEKDQLNADAAQLQSEKSQLDNENSQLSTEERQQRAQVDAYNQEGRQLTAECQQLLQQVAAALEHMASARTSSAAPGGDQGRPTLARPRQVAGDGGDPVSRRWQNDALDAYEVDNGVEVDKQPAWAWVTPATVGKLPPSAAIALQITRTYDGLIWKRSSDTYTGLVVTSPTTGINPGSKGIDNAINAGGQAVTVRDGKRLIIDQVATVASKRGPPKPTVCGADCTLVSDGTPTTATVSPRKLLDDARALHSTVPESRDKYVTVATGQLGGQLVYAVNQNSAGGKALQALADQLGYKRVIGTNLTPMVNTDAEQILYGEIDEGNLMGDGIIASSRPACGPIRSSGKPGQDCAGRAMNYPNLQLWEQPRKR